MSVDTYQTETAPDSDSEVEIVSEVILLCYTSSPEPEQTLPFSVFLLPNRSPRNVNKSRPSTL